MDNATIKGGANTSALACTNGAKGIIRNCSVVGATITAVSGENFGGITGTNSGLIENTSFEGILNGRTHTGGVVGVNATAGIVKNCKVSGNINGATSVGGVVGTNDGIVQGAYVDASITATGSNCGGIIGNNRDRSTNTKVVDCEANATINGYQYVGGIVGTNGAEISNCKSTSKITATGSTVGGIVATNSATITNCEVEGVINGTQNVAGLAGANSGIIQNSSTKNISITATNTTAGGLVGSNTGTVKNSSASANIMGANNVGGFCGSNQGTIENSVSNAVIKGKGANVAGFVATNSGNIVSSISNAQTQNNITSGTVYTAGFVATNNASGTISNCQADGDSNASYGNSAGFVGSNNGKVSCSNATGNSFGSIVCGGFVASNNTGAIIEECFATGNSISSTNASGGFAGINNKGTINDCYSTGNAQGSSYLGGFVGRSYGDINNCYSTGNVVQNAGASTVYNGGFCGTSESCTISNCYSTGTVNSNGGGGAFVRGAANTVNCYANSQQPDNITFNQAGVELKTSQWLNNSENLRFLGDAYDYYYTPPGLLNNPTDHPEEYSQFQIGSNSGEKNMIELNLVFRMNFYSANVSTVENAEASIKNTDAFIDRISQKRSEIGATRNKLDSVMQSQAIKLENLSSSHSTMMDTDFASETAKLARQQILQQAASSLLSQANQQKNIALNLLL